jgi:CelD/BcsL family acetyltransferase involved in cellulose biosynthesis
MVAWHFATSFVEVLGEGGIDWLLMHAGLMKSPGTAVRPQLSFEITDRFDFTSAEYLDLFGRADATAFQHPLWLDRAFAHLAGHDRGRAVLVARAAGDGRMMLMLPMIRRKVGPFSMLDTADLDVADYNAPVIDQAVVGNTEAVRQIRHALRKLRLVRMRRVRDGALPVLLLSGSARLRAMDYQAHEVELTGPSEGWQSRLLTPDFARLLRSKRKRLAAKGTVALEELSEPAAIRTAFERMRHFRQARWNQDALGDPACFAFYLDVAIAGAATGFARTYALTVDGTAHAVLFGVHHRGRFCFLLLGFDHEKFRNHSTGLLLLESIIDDCIRRGGSVFDLTIGDEQYKQYFATRSVALSEVWMGQRPWTQLAPIALGAARKARALVRKVRRI